MEMPNSNVCRVASPDTKQRLLKGPGPGTQSSVCGASPKHAGSNLRGLHDSSRAPTRLLARIFCQITPKQQHGFQSRFAIFRRTRTWPRFPQEQCRHRYDGAVGRWGDGAGAVVSCCPIFVPSSRGAFSRSPGTTGYAPNFVSRSAGYDIVGNIVFVWFIVF